ncbi:MAG: DNA-3-methyladenine glycosylase 2 family protein [Phycisphaerales bacterium]|nr:DNA-3-methyladenine glycosylase 2 family protein [Phycisphaerae bacterium]NNF43882.1 DNA-3-methyladenine glycosylase 2 family protein [Phycisphaerales bacterium]NNM27025.1 DNA-3-methyladenine glycosylase 2 family protein [Phycisphaerales bacterium]
MPDAVATLAGADADLAAVVDRIGTPPLWGRPPGFATLVRIILGQQVSLGSADAAYRRLQATVGRVCPGSVAAAAESRLRRAGLTRQKAAYCRNLAIAVTSGGLSLKTVATLDDAAARAQLVRVPGIGPWTADIYLLMALRRPDIWPDGDLALIKAAQRVKRLRQPPDSATLRTLASAWSPWRAVAARVLWHEYLSW